MDFDIFRILFAFMSGYFLSLSGSLSQLVAHNPLASPSTLGMDGAAVLAVIIGQTLIVSFFPGIELTHISLMIFILFILVIKFALTLGKNSDQSVWAYSSVKKIILFGLSFNLFIGAIFSILLFLFMAMNYEFPSGLWFGSFKQYQQKWLIGFIVLFIASVFFIKRYGKKLAVLNLGDDFALGLGVDIKKLQFGTLLFAFLLTGVVICSFGVFSFLGLILPHLLRSLRLFKVNMYKELWLGGFLSGAVLSVIDFCCYHFTFMGAELPVGMVSGVMGSFLLIVLVLQQKV